MEPLPSIQVHQDGHQCVEHKVRSHGILPLVFEGSESRSMKKGSTPKLPPWEPCDRLMEQQRPAAPIREPSERRFHLENVAGFQGRRRKKADCLWLG